MQKFDFITDEEFRKILQNNYNEMRICHNHQAWTGVLVLAGSIVEALLVDYLTIAPNSPSNIDPLTITLDRAISTCKDLKIISPRNADFCSVIRSYRNLIHPGRQVRLNEPLPSEQSATIATSLVDLIIDEVAKVRKINYGPTAEQLLSKIEKDNNSLAIFNHLVNETKESELERFVISVLPRRYEELFQDYWENNFDCSQELERLRKAFRVVFDKASVELKTKCVHRFLILLKQEANGERIDIYADAFFNPIDLGYLEEKDRVIVKNYLFSKYPNPHSIKSARSIKGLAIFLTSDEIQSWVDPFIKAIVSAANSNTKSIKDILIEECESIQGDVFHALLQRFEDWIGHFKQQGKQTLVDEIVSLKDQLIVIEFPF